VLHGDEIFYRLGPLALVIHVNGSNEVNIDMKKKGKPTTGFMTNKREDHKMNKY